jgi:hypothetical protein
MICAPAVKGASCKTPRTKLLRTLLHHLEKKWFITAIVHFNQNVIGAQNEVLGQGRSIGMFGLYQYQCDGARQTTKLGLFKPV